MIFFDTNRALLHFYNYAREVFYGELVKLNGMGLYAVLVHL